MDVLERMALLLLVIFIGLSAYAFWIITSPSEEVKYKPFVSNSTYPVFSKGVQFYPKMRFPDRKITYFIESMCSDDRQREAIEAFDILSRKTILSFSFSGDNPGIRVLCSEIAPEPEQEGHFVAGEGGPVEIINTSNYFVILESKISLFRPDKCDEPKIALHELFHALGFDHVNDEKSILYPVAECSQEIDNFIIEEINSLYKTEAAPDLMLEAVIANRVGKYLSFQANVSNIGLVDVSAANLSVYSEGKFVKSYPLNNIPIGTKKIISVSNFRIDGNPKNFEFMIELINPSSEISEDNNAAAVSLME